MSEVKPRPGDGLVRFFIRHERLFGIAGMVWLAVSCANYARFIDLPDIPFVTDEMALYFSAAYNAAWWGFVRPAFERRKSVVRNESNEANLGVAKDD